MLLTGGEKRAVVIVAFIKGVPCTTQCTVDAADIDDQIFATSSLAGPLIVVYLAQVCVCGAKMVGFHALFAEPPVEPSGNLAVSFVVYIAEVTRNAQRLPPSSTIPLTLALVTFSRRSSDD